MIRREVMRLLWLAIDRRDHVAAIQLRALAERADAGAIRAVRS